MLVPTDGISATQAASASGIRPVAATYALATSLAGFIGDGPTMPEGGPEATLSSAGPVVAGGTLVFGQPVLAKPPETEQIATTTDRNVNLRRGPGTRYKVMRRLRRGIRLRVLDRKLGWYRVTVPDGALGWVAAAYVRLESAPTAPPAASAPGDAVPEIVLEADVPPPAPQALSAAARLATRYVGAPYVWGGESPDGFDCSGLTKYVYAQLGVALPHKASLQYSTRYGTRIGRLDDLQPGDLVFFVRTTRARGITHVGLYIGTGLMVTANTPRTGVEEVSVYGSYWQSRFAGGIRPSP